MAVDGVMDGKFVMYNRVTDGQPIIHISFYYIHIYIERETCVYFLINESFKDMVDDRSL